MGVLAHPLSRQEDREIHGITLFKKYIDIMYRNNVWMLKSKIYRRKNENLFYLFESYHLPRFRFIVNTDCGMRSVSRNPRIRLGNHWSNDAMTSTNRWQQELMKKREPACSLKETKEIQQFTWRHLTSLECRKKQNPQVEVGYWGNQTLSPWC